MGRGHAVVAVTLLLSLAISACSRSRSAVAIPEDPEQALRSIEQRLVEASTVRFTSSALAEGVVEADLHGTVDLVGAEVRWDHDGTFVDREVDLHLRRDGDLITGGNGDYRFEQSVPQDLRAAMIVGLTRMGILHNLARLAGAQPPDRAEGGVDDWLGLEQVRWGEARERDGRVERPIEFDLVVGGVPSASVRLWVDTLTALPVEREQSVAFPQGEMRVIETYEDWVVEGVPGP